VKVLLSILLGVLMVTAPVQALPVTDQARPGTGAGTREGFRGEILRIDRQLRKRMVGSSWHRGCPVPLRDLRLLKLRILGFDGRVRAGRLIVHETAAPRMVSVFRRLFEVGFPIRRMRLVDAYGADDHRSMNADNTSAFNCREVAGQPGVWSRHAFGRAIDINPVENPYVSGSHVSPAKGRPFARRSPLRKGMIPPRGHVFRAFAAAGWEWGGNWTGQKDYQHFSASGD
jgi:poly-gamma-glutamate synthesis protein (capsule biosynthesis protein)